MGLLKVKELNIILLNYLTYRYNYDRKFQGAKYDEKGNPTNKAAELRQKFEGQKPEEVIDGLFENWKLDNFTSLNNNSVKRFKQIIYMLSNYTYSKFAINKGYNDDVKLFSPYYFELTSIPQKIEDGYWEFKDCNVKLFSSYFEFYGGNNPIINYWKEIYASDKVFNKVDNKWYFAIWRGIWQNNITDWRIIKFKHNELKNKTVDSYDIFKLNLIWIWYSFSWLYDIGIENPAGFSAWWFETYPNIKSVYCWDGEGEPQTPEIGAKTGKITNWNLKTENENKKYEIKIWYNDISENNIHQLEANHFNWLSITEELESNNIPSLIPAEINLSDGEYGKYKTNLIVSSENIEKLLNLFSTIKNNIYSKLKWIDLINHISEKNIKLSFSQSIKILNQIEISGIWGYGNYDINIFIEKPSEKIIQGKDINLELIEETPIGSKISGKDRNTYLQLIEFDTWYLWKNGIENEKSYSNIAVVNFLKQSNSVIFSYPPIKEQININNLQLFSKNNEKLSLIILQI